MLDFVTAKTRARLLSSIPVAAAGNRVVLMDLHADGITHYFEGAIRPVHVYAKPVVIELLGLGGQDFVLACTDAGRAKWVESLANEIGVPASFVLKRRLSGSQTEVTAVSAACMTGLRRDRRSASAPRTSVPPTSRPV